MNPLPFLRWIISVVLILSLVLAVDYFFLHILLPIKRQNQTATLDAPPRIREKLLSSAATLLKATNSSFSTCLSELPIGAENLHTPKELLEVLQAQNLIAETFLVAKELSYQKSKDENYEIHIQYSANADGTPTDLVFLKKDSQGKSSKVESIDGLTSSLEPAKIADIENSEFIVKRKIKNKGLLKNGWTIETWLENHEPTSLQLKTNSKILSCRGLACVCR